MQLITFYIAPSLIHGNGLFTKAPIKKGDQLFIVADIYVKNSTTPYGKMVNHSKNGNTLMERAGEKYILVAIRDIEAGEEICSDYLLSPSKFAKNIAGYKEI